MEIAGERKKRGYKLPSNLEAKKSGKAVQFPAIITENINM